MKLINSLVCSALLLGGIPTALAQLDPVCRQVAADPDGDGFGWQDNGSCIVTQESEPAPEFTNLETREFINLTRAYWNAPVDIYNKTISCVAHRFSSDTGTYVADNDPSRETHYTFHYTHLPLTTSAPYTGSLRSEHIVSPGPDNDSFETYYNETFVTWSMDNGIYTGGAPFTESPYVEIVMVPSTNRKAIKTWRGNGEFVQCTAVPTGIPPGLEIVDASNGTGETNTDNVNSETNTTVDNISGADNSPGIDNSTNSSDVTGNSNETENTESLNSPGSNVSAVINSDASPSSGISQPSNVSNSGGGSFGLWLLLPLIILRRLRGWIITQNA